MNIKTFWYFSLCHVTMKWSNKTKKVHAHQSNEFDYFEFFWALRITPLVAKNLTKSHLLYITAVHTKVIQFVAKQKIIC